MNKINIPIKICFVCPWFYPAFIYGGPIFSNYYLAKKLSEKGVSVQVVTTNANGSEKLNVDTNQNIQEASSFWIRYFDETIMGRFSFSLFNGLKEYIQEAHLIHATDIFSTTFLMTLFYTRKTEHKIVLSPRGVLAKWGLQKRSFLKSFWLNIFIKPNLARINFHATAEMEKKDILALFPKAKVFIVPNGIEVVEEATIKAAKNKFAKWLHKRGIENDHETQHICSLGRIHHKKGFDILIKAFANIQERFPKTQLMIGGSDDGHLNYLKSMVHSLGLDKKVWFLGQLDDENKSILLAGSDLFALPSHNENFGNVYLEALNFGTPVLATKNTPWKVVVDYKCGLCINNSVEETTNAISQLLLGNFSEYSNNARHLAKQFSFENTIPKMEKKYFEILGQVH